MTHSNPFGAETAPLIASSCNVTGQLQKGNDTVVIDLGNSTSMVSAQILNKGVGTIYFEVTIDGASWFRQTMVDPRVEGALPVSEVITNGIWQAYVTGWRQFRVRADPLYAGQYADIVLATSEPSVDFSAPFRPPSGYTASNLDWMVISTAAGPVSILLDPDPDDLDRIRFEPSDDSWGNPNFLVVDPQGQPINGIVDTLTGDVPAPFDMVFYVGTGWRVLPRTGRDGAPGLPGPPGISASWPSISPAFVANAYAMNLGELEKTFVVTTGSGADQVLTLVPLAGGTYDGRGVAFYKADTGTAALIIKRGATEDVHLMTQGDYIRYRVNDNTFNSTDYKISDVTRVYNANDTWPKRPRLQRLILIGIGGASSGAAGRRGAAASARFGGGGGSPGAMVTRTYTAASITAPTLSVTIGADTPGAPGQTVDDTDGANGSVGSEILFGTIFRARGSTPAPTGGRNNAGGAGGTALVATDRYPVNNGGTSSATAVPTATGANGGGGAGGAGGGISLANAGFAGSNGGTGNAAGYTTSNGGTGGAVGVNGNDGVAASANPSSDCGGGGGGGGGNPAGTGGNGGNGGGPGGAGGGGGASLNGFVSGAGGIGRGCRLTLIEIYAR